MVQDDEAQARRAEDVFGKALGADGVRMTPLVLAETVWVKYHRARDVSATLKRAITSGGLDGFSDQLSWSHFAGGQELDVNRWKDLHSSRTTKLAARERAKRGKS